MGPRLVSTLLLWSLVVWLVLSQCHWGVFLLVAVVGLLAQWEFYELQEMKGLRVFKKAGTACGAFFFVCSYFYLTSPDTDAPMWKALETLPLLLVILGATSRQVFEQDQKMAVVTVALTLLGFFYAPFLLNFLPRILFLGQEQGIYLAVYLVAVTKLMDAGAYVFGSILGRHQMSPRISPKKTWEGLIGGLVVVVFSSVVLVEWIGEPLAMLEGIHPWILGPLLALISVVGDLVESVVKRDADCKDSGGLIPGIGGALDLVDSLLFTAPLFYFYLLVFCQP